MPAGRARGGVEARIAARECAVSTERAHDERIQMDLVGTAREVGDDVGVRRAGGDGEVEAVGARASGQRIDAELAVDCVGGVVARDHVVDVVAGAVDGAGDEHEIVDPCWQDIRGRSARDVEAAVLYLDDDVAAVVDEIDIVASAAIHTVNARAAVERVVAVEAYQRVVAGEAVDRIAAARAGERIVAGGTVDRRRRRRGRRRGRWSRRRSRCRRRTRRAEDVEVARDEARRALQCGDELRDARAIAVGVVIELAGARVVDDAIIRIVAAARAGGGIEARVAHDEAAGAADGGERGHVELDAIPVTRERGDAVGVSGAVLVEDDIVLIAAAGERVVAGAACEPIIAGVAVKRVVPGAAEDCIYAAAAGEEVVATEALNDVVVAAADERVVAVVAVESSHKDPRA